MPKVKSVPTVTDTLFAERKIPNRIVGISLVPTTQTSGSALANGLISLGGVERTRFTGALSWFPHVPNVASSDYFNLAMVCCCLLSPR